MSALPASVARRIVESDAGCWIFTGATQSRGYGSVGIGNGRTGLAHRVAYEALVGPIPAGMTLDHLCCVKRCVNPAHLEPVAPAENLRRHHERSGSCYCGSLDCLPCRAREGSSARNRRFRARQRLDAAT